MHVSRALAKQNCGPAERKQRGPLCLCFVFKSMHFPSLISNTMLLKHAGVYAQPLHSSLPSTQAFSLLYVHLQQHRYPALLCPLEVKCDHSLALHTHPKTALIPGPEMQSASTWITCSYQLLQDGELSIQQPQRKKTTPSPLASRIKAPHLHTDPALVRQQLKPQCSGEGVGTHQPQIYILDFYPFTS